MDRIRPIENRYERKARSVLGGAVPPDASVLVKPRLADVVQIAGSGLSDEDYSYALSSHFDFVIERNNKMEFAIEFEGPGHIFGPRSLDNEARKNHICRRLGLPLIRIGTSYLRPINGTIVLDWYIRHVYRMRSSWLLNRHALQPHMVLAGTHSVKESDDARSAIGDYQAPFPLSDPFLRLRASFKLWLERDGFEVQTYSERTVDGFMVAHVNVQLDEDTSILGSGCAQEADFLPCAKRMALDMALLDAADHINAFGADQYSGLPNKSADEWITLFRAHCAEPGLVRNLCSMPMHRPMVDSWIAAP